MVTVLKAGLQLQNVPSPYQWMVIGVVLLLAVSVSKYTTARAQSAKGTRSRATQP